MWNLLFVTAGWDHEQGEPKKGGYDVEECVSLVEARAALEAYRHVARRMWGPGQLVITDPHHNLTVIETVTFEGRSSNVVSVA